MVSVDGTDCKFQQILIENSNGIKKKINKSLGSFKHKYAGLCYEIAMCIKTSNIVWINGPFLPGDNPDIQVFRQGLIDMLEEGEQVEADNGYIGEAPTYVKCPASPECLCNGSSDEV